MSAAPALVTLENKGARAVLAPSAGGRLMRWEVNGRPVLHWPPAPDWSNPAKIRGGNPLLFPFIARTFFDGEIGRWRGPDGVVRPAPMHGLLRAAGFSVQRQEAARVVLSIAWNESMAEAYPFPFVFSVDYALEAASLAVAFTVQNTGREPLPYSLGNHFYFEVPSAERAQWQLICPCRRWARQKADGSLQAEGPPAPGGRLDDPALVDLFHLGPPRHGVELRHEEDGRRITFDLPDDAAGRPAWYAVTTWTETATSDFFCVEPWSALPDAVHNGQGLRWLKPGARETLRLRLTTEGW